MAQLDITTEQAERRWGASEITEDDLGPWHTFAFTLKSGTLAALVREVENPPHPGYILTVISESPPRETLEEFLTEADLSEWHVLHKGFE
ncbi:hypothetical protein [Streptomyces klenkii]